MSNKWSNEKLKSLARSLLEPVLIALNGSEDWRQIEFVDFNPDSELNGDTRRAYIDQIFQTIFPCELSS